MRKKLFAFCLLALPSLSYAMSHSIDSVHNLSQVDVVADMLRKKVKTNNLARMDVPLAMLPMTINSIDMKDLTKRGLYQPMDALRFATGAGFRRTYGAFLQLNIRGFDHSPVIMDGMRDERTTFNSYPLSDLSDVESLEILKGPASVLQGHSAVGGVLNITRRKATQKTNVNASLDYNTFEQMRVVASAGGYLGDGWSMLSGIAHSRGEGWRSKRDQNFKVYTTLSKVWDNNELDFRLSYHNDFYGTEAGLPAVFDKPVYDVKTNAIYLQPGQLQPGIRKEARYNNESDAMYNRNLNFSANWTSQLTSWLKLREQFSFNGDDIDYFSTETLTYPTSDKLNEKGEAPYPHYYLHKEKDGSEIRRYVDLSRVQLTYPLRFRHMAKTVQNQLSLESKLYTGDFKHNVNLGYAVSYMRRTSFTGYNFGGSEGIQDITGPGLFSYISAYNPKSAGPMETRFSKANPSNVLSNGIYVQDVIEFSPMLQAMAALRYDHYRYERADRVDSNDGDTRYNKPEKYYLALSQALTYRFGLVFTPIEKINIYGSLANFYKPYMTTYDPTVIYVNKAGQTFIPTPDKEIFAPMRGYQIELGTRLQLSSWLEMTASAYYIHQNNVIKTLGPPVEVKENDKVVKKTVRGQVGNQYSQGFEIDLISSPIEGLLLQGGYSYTDARVGHVAKNDYSNDNEVKGNRLSFIPLHKFYSLGSYMVSEGIFKGLGGHYSLSYTGERFRNLENTLSFEGFWQFDLGVSYEIMRGLTVGLDAYNVLNTISYQESLGRQLIPSEPRSFRASLTYTL